MSTRWWRACTALRIRVSMSAIGSVMCLPSPHLVPSVATGLPTALDDAGDLAPQRQLAEAQPAQRELPQVGPRTAALAAAVAVPDRVLGRLVEVLDGLCSRGHEISLRLVLPERHADQLQQPPGFLIGLRGRDDRNV